MVFHHGGAAANSLLTAIESISFIMNSDTCYVSLVQVVAVESLVRQSRRRFSIMEVCLKIRSLQKSRVFNLI